ncbi:BatD family protein [Vibrio lamellibrachiae]|uniref:BatD family protein n=1 Tax=Vibrio lamellibrachiae TaxID=2910253 RepID=UPI003D1117EE
MSKGLKKSVFKLLLISLLIFVGHAQASVMSELQEQGKVSIKTWVSGDIESISTHEQVIVNIEVSTDTWFTKGTRIHRIEVDDALVINRSSFAINSTERINGKTYSKQLWEIVLYPLVSGEYRIPPVTVELEVKNGKDKVSGQLTTSPLRFRTHKPMAQMTKSHHWVTATVLEVTDRWEVIRSASNEVTEESSVRVGDSLKRVITTTANDTSIMLLPDLLQEPVLMIDSLAFYPQAAKNEEHQVRGERYSKKVETAIYIVKQAGRITLPPIDVYWWNPDTKSNTKVILEEQTWQVTHTFSSWISLYKSIIISSVLLVLLITVSLFKVYRYYKSRSLPRWVRTLIAIKRNLLPNFESVLYERLLIKYDRYRLIDGNKLAGTSDNEEIKIVHQRYKRNETEDLSRYQLINIWIRSIAKKY